MLRRILQIDRQHDEGRIPFGVVQAVEGGPEHAIVAGIDNDFYGWIARRYLPQNVDCPVGGTIVDKDMLALIPRQFLVEDSFDRLVTNLDVVLLVIAGG